MERYFIVSTQPTTTIAFNPDGTMRENVLPAGSILNTCVWDGESDWQPPEGCVAVRAADYTPPG